MYGIFTYIQLIFYGTVNVFTYIQLIFIVHVGRYTIHAWYGYMLFLGECYLSWIMCSQKDISTQQNHSFWLIKESHSIHGTGIFPCIYHRYQVHIYQVDIPVPWDGCWNPCCDFFFGTSSISARILVLPKAWFAVGRSIHFINPSLPNTFWVGVWTHKYLPRRPLWGPSTYSQGIWRMLED